MNEIRKVMVDKHLTNDEKILFGYIYTLGDDGFSKDHMNMSSIMSKFPELDVIDAVQSLVRKDLLSVKISKRDGEI